MFSASVTDSSTRSVNENYDWERAGGGIAAFAHYFETVIGTRTERWFIPKNAGHEGRRF